MATTIQPFAIAPSINPNYEETLLFLSADKTDDVVLSFLTPIKEIREERRPLAPLRQLSFDSPQVAKVTQLVAATPPRTPGRAQMDPRMYESPQPQRIAPTMRGEESGTPRSTKHTPVKRRHALFTAAQAADVTYQPSARRVKGEPETATFAPENGTPVKMPAAFVPENGTSGTPVKRGKENKKGQPAEGVKKADFVTPKAPPKAPRKPRDFSPNHAHIKEVTVSLEVNAKLEAAGFRLTRLGSGDFKNAYLLADDQPRFHPEYENHQLVVKVYRDDIVKEQAGLIRKYTQLMMHQYNALKDLIPVAPILNDPVEDGFILCLKIEGPLPREEVNEEGMPYTISLQEELMKEVKGVRSKEDLANLSESASALLAQQRAKLEAGVLMQQPVDLGKFDNFIINDAGEVVLIDFFEMPEGYFEGSVPGVKTDGNPWVYMKKGLEIWHLKNKVLKDYFFENIKLKADLCKHALFQIRQGAQGEELAALEHLVRENMRFKEAYEIFSVQ